MCVCACVYINMDGRVHAVVRGQYLVFSSGTIALSFEMGSLTGLELADSLRLADQ